MSVYSTSHGGDCGGDPPEGDWNQSFGCQGSGGTPGRRQKNKNQALKNVFKKNSRNLLEVAFEKGDNGTYIAVGLNSSNFNSLVGTIISKIPYHYPSWRQVPADHTSTIYDELQEYFDVMRHLDGPGGDKIKSGLNSYFGIIYKNQKSKFGQQHFVNRGGINNAEALREQPPSNYGLEDWHKFVDFRCGESFQKRSEANKGCRAKQETVRGVSPIELYRRMRVQNGDFTDPQARQNYAHMIQMRDDPNNTLTEDEIMQEVLGERRGWTRGVGQKLPQSAFAADSSSSNSRRYTEEEVQQMMASYTAPLWIISHLDHLSSGGGSHICRRKCRRKKLSDATF